MPSGSLVNQIENVECELCNVKMSSFNGKQIIQGLYSIM